MHKYENEYNLLLKQREQLIGSIQQANKSFHTAVFSALTVLSMVLTLLFHSNDPLSGWYLFLLAQVVLGLFFFVAGLLFSTNNRCLFERTLPGQSSFLPRRVELSAHQSCRKCIFDVDYSRGGGYWIAAGLWTSATLGGNPEHHGVLSTSYSTCLAGNCCWNPILGKEF